VLKANVGVISAVNLVNSTTLDITNIVGRLVGSPILDGQGGVIGMAIFDDSSGRFSTAVRLSAVRSLIESVSLHYIFARVGADFTDSKGAASFHLVMLGLMDGRFGYAEG
jgi:hypothetical protein